MTDIGVLLRTYLEPFQWLGLGSGGAIPLWNASRLVRSYRRVRNELEGVFFDADAVFQAFPVNRAVFSAHLRKCRPAPCLQGIRCRQRRRSTHPSPPDRGT